LSLLNDERTRTLLRAADFRTLFIELLGWDHLTQHLDITVDGKTYKLTAIAHKRGMVAFECTYEGAQPPEYPIRRKIDQQVTKNVREHFIIYTDPARTLQIWQWVKREAGKPTDCREHHFHRNQSGEALVQKLEAIKVGLDEEEQLTIVEVASKAKKRPLTWKRSPSASMTVSRPSTTGSSSSLKASPMLNSNNGMHRSCSIASCLFTLLKVWKNVRNGETRICLWLESEEYLLVLAERKDHVLPWTAYMVDRTHRKQKLQKEFEEYRKKKRP